MTKSRDLANAATALNAVTAAELGFVDGVTSAIQTQIDTKLATATAATTYVPNSLADAKGDLLTATADNTPARLAVGNNGETLVADSSTSTGLRWQGAISVAVFNTTVPTITNATFTTLLFDSESWDTNSMHSTVTNNSRITVPKTGYYKIELLGIWQSNAVGNRAARFLKNGSSISSQFQKGNPADLNYYYTYTAYLTANDYLEMQMYQDSGSPLAFYTRSQDGFFLVTWIGA